MPTRNHELLTSAEARAVARESYIYGFPMVGNPAGPATLPGLGNPECTTPYCWSFNRSFASARSAPIRNSHGGTACGEAQYCNLQLEGEGYESRLLCGQRRARVDRRLPLRP